MSFNSKKGKGLVQLIMKVSIFGCDNENNKFIGAVLNNSPLFININQMFCT